MNSFASVRGAFGRCARLGALFVATLLPSLSLSSRAASAQDVPLCTRSVRSAHGSLALNHHEVALAIGAHAFSERNPSTFSLRPTDDTVDVTAVFDLTDGMVSLFKGGASWGEANIGLRLRVLVDGTERCNLYREVTRVSAPPVPGHYPSQVVAQKVAMTCASLRVPAGSSLVVEGFGESNLTIGGPFFGAGDIQGDVSLRGSIASVTVAHCSPNVDADGDGSNDLNDCNDVDSSRFPGNTELCDGRDNDCDDAVDDGVTTQFFLDADGDTWGGEASIAACSRPDGYVTSPGDCDDGTALANPDLPEVCGDGIDNDCSGAIDDLSPAPIAWRDADGDGLGDAARPTRECAPGAGFVANDDDCNDADPRLGDCNTPISTMPAGLRCSSPRGLDASLTCDDVVVAGETTCRGYTCDVDAPVDFSVRFTDQCFELTSTATCNGDPAAAIVCIEYDPRALTASGPCAADPEGCLAMFHCVAGEPCPSVSRPPLPPAPGTSRELNVYCAYVDDIPRPPARPSSFSASLRGKRPSVRTAAGNVFFLGIDSSDPDFDTIPSRLDNCPTLYNPTQRDSDGDGIGDRCDPR